MSEQLVAPHSVARSAMNNISVRSCSAFSARGSGKSEKYSANRSIPGSFRIRSHLQNPILHSKQQLTQTDMRFPCLCGGGLGWGDHRQAQRALARFHSGGFCCREIAPPPSPKGVRV